MIEINLESSEKLNLKKTININKYMGKNLA